VEPREPERIVREMLEAFRRGDYETALSAYDPDVEGDFTHLADGRVVRGREGIRREVARWQGAWENLSFEYEVAGIAGDQVVVFARQTGTGRGSGAPMEMEYGQVYAIRGEAITWMKTYLDRNEALEDAGLEASEPS
jgi:ketosteroid isomerase-like protein